MADKKTEKERSVEERLKDLYHLQTLLSEIDRIKTLRGELPNEVKDREDEIVRYQTRINKNEEEIAQLQSVISERKVLRVDRLQKIDVSAMKQSLKTTLPVIDELTPIADVIRSGFDGQRFIAYCDKDTERKNFVKEYAAGGNVLVMIGPEGDFSAEEVALSLANGFQPVTFGESRLRTETAGIFACAAVHSKIQMTKL